MDLGDVSKTLMLEALQRPEVRQELRALILETLHTASSRSRPTAAPALGSTAAVHMTGGYRFEVVPDQGNGLISRPVDSLDPRAELGSVRVEDLPPVLTIIEAAAVLRVCKKTLYEAVQRGDLKAARLGRKGVLRFKREVILQLLGR